MYNIIKNHESWYAISKEDMREITEKALQTAPATSHTFSGGGYSVTGTRYDGERYTVYETRDSRYEHPHYSVYDETVKKQVGYWERGDLEHELWIL